MDGGDRIGGDGDDGLSYGNDEEPRIGSIGRFSESRSGYGVNGCKTESDGCMQAVSKGSGPVQLARMSFDKDNPVDQK